MTISLRTSYKLGVPSVLLTLLGECRTKRVARTVTHETIRYGSGFRHLIENYVWVSALIRSETASPLTECGTQQV